MNTQTQSEIRHPRPLSPTPAIQHPLYTCVSYGPATTTLQILHLPDTNRVFSATKVSNPPICVSTPTRPTSPPPTTTKSANPPSPPQTAPCYTCVSYGPDTTMLQMLHLLDTNPCSPDTKSVARPYLSVAPVHPKLLAPHHDEIRQPTLTRPNCPMRLDSQLRPSYDHETNETPPRYKSLFFRYEKSLTPLSERRTRLPQNPRPTPRRNPPIPSNPGTPPQWNSLFQYEPATAVERMERLSDTNNVLSDTDRVPLPICDGTVPHPSSRPHPPHPPLQNTTTIPARPSTPSRPTQSRPIPAHPTLHPHIQPANIIPIH